MDYQVGIVGAGFGGIIAALKLKQAGVDSFAVFERADDVGGVWRDNVYPGCACDIRSHLYSIRGQPNPEWRSEYAAQPEILQYIRAVVARNGLRPHIRPGVNLVELAFEESHGCWRLSDRNGRTWRVKSVILATGPHSRPSMPRFPGQETFRGRSFHSSAWDSSIDLDGKLVAVVGTGASAVQIVPNIAPKVARLLVFQRSAAWLLPRGDRKIGALQHFLFRRFPWTQTISRTMLYWFLEFIGLAFFGNSTVSRWLTGIALRKLKREVRDPSIRAKLTPSYTIGCKRVLVADDFYPTFNRPNVELITEGIREITPTRIRTADGREHEIDVIVFATGFIVADTDDYVRVVGKGGRVLTDEWDRNDPQAYLGINVAGYPNLAFILGPNSGLAHSSALHIMESQMTYVLHYLRAVEKGGASGYVDVDHDVQKTYNARLQRRLAKTVWASGCTSWYLNRRGQNNTIYPGLTNEYRRVTSTFNEANYVFVRGST